MNRRANTSPSRKLKQSNDNSVHDGEVERIPNASGIVERRQMWQGPVPPPAVLREFDELVPGTAKAMLDLASSESEHRRKLEEATTNANITAQQRALDLEVTRSKAVATSDVIGQAAGFVVSLTCIAGSIYLGMHDKEVIAGAIAIIPSAAVIQAFFAKKGSAQGKDENPKK